MASVSLPSAFFESLQDSAGDSPVLATAGAYLLLNQRVDEPPALPTVSGAVSISTPFHNLAQGITSGGFTGSFNNSIGNRGVRVQDGYLAASHKIGHGTHWEEFIGLISGSMNIARVKYLGNDNQTPSRGIFQIAYTGGAWRFQFVQSSTTTVTFDQVAVPISQTGAPGAVPSPFYCRLLREFNTTGTGAINLVVDDGTTTQVQTVTGVARHDDTITTNSYQFGRLNSSGIADPTIEMWWHRSLASDSFVTPGTLASTYWASPNLNSTISYYSDGLSSTADSGADDQYWHQFGITQGGAFTGLLNNGGGSVKARVAATNTAPSGSTSALFSGVYFPVQNVPELLSDPQGRYLAIEWRYEPGTDWPLGMGTVHLTRDTNEFGTVTHFPAAQGVALVPLTVAGEGSSQGTLPFTVERTTKTSHTLRVHRADFEFPYTHSRPLGTAARRSYDVRWVLTEAERDTLVQFFEDRDGGEEAFTWTAPGDAATSIAALVSPLEIEMLAPGAFEIRCQLMEVLSGA